MKWSLIDWVLAFALLLSLAAIGQCLAQAPACAELCYEITDYASGAPLSCAELQVADCRFCYSPGGSCLDPGPTYPFCKKNSNLPQAVAPVTLCDLVCSLAPNGYAQATNPAGVGQFTNSGNVYQCFATAAP